MEKQVIQSVGFRNTVKDGEVTGFQFKIRLPYYRGIFLSQLRPGTLFVDGQRIEKDQITWCFGGEEYTNAQIAELAGIAVDTVKQHCKHICKKLGAENRHQAVRRAKELGII